MPFKNAEIKARCSDPEFLRSYLRDRGARFVGTDRQTDTYFNLPSGRMKVRHGTIEKALIWYQRPDHQGGRTADGMVVPLEDPAATRKLLARALGIKVEVKKIREIYFIGHSKFHLDEVEGLGSFFEIEVQDHDGTHPEESLHRLLQKYMEELGVEQDNLIGESYSDMLLKKTGQD